MAFDTLERRQRARMASVGRASELLLDEVAGVVLARVVDSENKSADVYVEQGSCLITVFSTGDPQSVVAHLYEKKPSTLLLVVVVRRARWWHRLEARFLAWKFERRYSRNLKAEQRGG